MYIYFVVKNKKIVKLLLNKDYYVYWSWKETHLYFVKSKREQ